MLVEVPKTGEQDSTTPSAKDNRPQNDETLAAERPADSPLALWATLLAELFLRVQPVTPLLMLDQRDAHQETHHKEPQSFPEQLKASQKTPKNLADRTPSLPPLLGDVVSSPCVISGPRSATMEGRGRVDGVRVQDTTGPNRTEQDGCLTKKSGDGHREALF